MSARRPALALLALCLAACGEELVHIHFTSSPNWPHCLPEDLGLAEVGMVMAQLHVGPSSNPTLRQCVNIKGLGLGTLEALETQFKLQRKGFTHIPSEGPWKLVIAGYPTDCSVWPTQSPQLCGMIGGDVFPPDSELTVQIACLPRTCVDCDAKEVKACGPEVHP